VDLDGFKSYNDHYGYLQGDQVILQLAALLRSTLSQRLDFVGHVGGDDFVLLMRSRDWRARVDLVLERFATVTARLEQNQCQRLQTSHESVARLPPCGTPGLSISVAALDSEAIGCSSVDEIAARLAQLKKRAKAHSGNSFILQSGERVVDLRSRGESDAAASPVITTAADVA
jgi:diguanylate cyclase (GGDEF)-like protein